MSDQAHSRDQAMQTPIVIVHSDKAMQAKQVLQTRHPDLKVHCCETYRDLPDVISRTRADIVYSVRFAGTPDFPRAALLDSKTVKWVSVGGSGTDHLNPWDPHKLTVTNAAGVAADMMAQYVLGMMLHFSLRLPQFLEAKRGRRWIAGQVEPIADKVVLIIGLGKTGQAVARLAKANGMKTLGVRARPQPVACVDAVHGVSELSQLWERADYVAVCVPLVESTRALISSDAFRAMKEMAVLIDVSRGGVVDEQALLDALDSDLIRGAALDVFSTEPLPDDHPLWAYENVVITPHCSSVFEGWEVKSVEMFSDNLTRYRRGETLTNVVDPKRGY
ncbi:MAG: D-2-hydroxyacid dehydrogenase [Ahrensia sp.]|nr:D-2-hydroxyacid dehydrogenase [Ahrensia sp.]